VSTPKAPQNWHNSSIICLQRAGLVPALFASGDTISVSH